MAAAFINAGAAREQGLLAGRQARCECGALRPSDGPAIGFKGELPFFVYRGEGSREALDICRCGYATAAHTPEVRSRNRALTCETFEPRGPHEFDSFYCGCRGWD